MSHWADLVQIQFLLLINNSLAISNILFNFFGLMNFNVFSTVASQKIHTLAMNGSQINTVINIYKNTFTDTAKSCVFDK